MCVEHYFPSVGGAQNVVRQIAQHLAKAGHEVVVVTSSVPARTSLSDGAVRIAEFVVYGNEVEGLVGDVKGYQRYLIDAKPDVVFVYAAQQWTLDAMFAVLTEMSCPKVLVPCGFSGLHRWRYRGYFRRLPARLGAFDALVFHTTRYRDYAFAEQHGITHNHVIPNGADPDEFQETPPFDLRSAVGAPRDALLLLTVATLNGRKGHYELLRALQRLPDVGKPVMLVLNGNAPEVPQRSPRAAVIGGLANLFSAPLPRPLLSLCDRVLARLMPYRVRVETVRRLAERIERSGNSARRVVLVDLPRAELVAAFRQADLFVFASNIEYSPLVLFEAAAAGLPFLSVPVGNAQEIAEWTGAGEICAASADSRGFTQADADVFASDIARLLRAPDRLAVMRSRGPVALRQRFAWSHLASQYLALFEQLVSERRRA